MATVSPVVLKCAVCSFESEIFADFQSHRCKLFYSIGHMYNNMQDFTKYRLIIIYIIVKTCLGQRKFDSKLCLIIIYEAFINVSGSIHNCDTLMTAYTFLKKSVSLICVYTRTLLQQFLQSYTIQLTAQR